MGGTNPYIGKVAAGKPRQKYTINFVLGDSGEQRSVEVDPGRIPYEHNGLPGSLLDIALGHGIQVDHACGGVCACSTCHVVVLDGLEHCNEAADAELDMLDLAPGVVEQSRLACQTVPNGDGPLTVVVPVWNRNLVQEPPH